MILPHEAWASLRLSGKGDGYLKIASLTSAVDAGYGPILFALGRGGEARLLIPCGSVPIRLPAVSTDNLKIHMTRLGDSRGRQQIYLDVTCQDQSLETAFSELAAGIMRRVDGGATPADAVTSAVDEFKALFTKASKDITREEILGLVGELYVLNRFATFRGTATDIWMGPWDQRHDFRSNFRALEVKTSGRSDTSRVRVHGADQLLPPTGGELVLIQLRLEEVPGGPLSIESLYKALAEQLGSAQRLNEGLRLLGCDDPSSAAWNCYQFALESMHGWEVRDGFPRLTSREMASGSFPPGIGNLEYTLDLSMAGRFLMELESLDNYMKKMIHD